MTGFVFRLTTTTGTCAVKQLIHPQVELDVRGDVEFVAAARAASVPTPAILSTLDGNVLLDLPDAQVRVTEWVDLRAVDPAAAGAALAGLQRTPFRGARKWLFPVGFRQGSADRAAAIARSYQACNGRAASTSREISPCSSRYWGTSTNGPAPGGSSSDEATRNGTGWHTWWAIRSRPRSPGRSSRTCSTRSNTAPPTEDPIAPPESEPASWGYPLSTAFGAAQLIRTDLGGHYDRRAPAVRSSPTIARKSRDVFHLSPDAPRPQLFTTGLARALRCFHTRLTCNTVQVWNEAQQHLESFLRLMTQELAGPLNPGGSSETHWAQAEVVCPPVQRWCSERPRWSTSVDDPRRFVDGAFVDVQPGVR